MSYQQQFHRWLHSDGSSFPIRVFFQCIMHGENLQMEGEDRGEERFNQPQTKI